VSVWPAILLSAVGCYLLKLLGLSVPERVLERPRVRAAAVALPVALLAALAAVQTFGVTGGLSVDARVAGVAAGVVALLLRAPFLVVVAVAALTAAALRALGVA
jgi:branched-subunit amino acid transport protein